MFRTALFALCSLLVACQTSTPRSSVDNLDAVLESIRAETGTPGLSASVARSTDGVIAHGVAGVRRLGSDDRIQRDDRFHVGSVAKPFTATLAGMLVAEGRLSWDTTMAGVFPEWREEMRPEYRAVTVADLLSHESGIPPFEEDGDFAGLQYQGTTAEQRRQFVRHVLTLAPVNPRGEYRYSNAANVAAAAMIEKITGRSWEELIQSRIAGPLDLTSLGFGWPAAADPQQPWGHQLKDGVLAPSDPRGAYQLPKVIAPAGDLHMSMDDLAVFLAEHLRSLRGRRAFLPTAIARTMHTRRVRSGLGFGVNKVATIAPVSMHSGSADTFLTFIAIAPDHDTAVAISANAADEAAETAMKKALRELLTRYAVAQ